MNQLENILRISEGKKLGGKVKSQWDGGVRLGGGEGGGGVVIVVP
jgi:hypothetical protein